MQKNAFDAPRVRAQELLSRMTLEEKLGQMMQIAYSEVGREEALRWAERGAGSFLHVLGEDADELQRAARATRLGVPVIFGIDAIHGHGLHNGATVFPTQLALSCSWDAELVRQVGRATAREVAADGLHWTFSPVLCVGRDTRWGRIDETFGEDPYLIGELGAAIIQGYQGDDLSAPDSILACAKHYLAYGESTGGRDAYDASVSPRKVREVFLPPFRRAVEAGCATFMAGYESVDGTPASASAWLLRTLLKEEMGFEGFVVTDWDNIGSLVHKQHVAEDIQAASKLAFEAGNDMIMNTNAFYEAALGMLRSGEIALSLLDDAVLRVLTVKFAMGLFDGRAQVDLSGRRAVFACPAHQALNLKAAQESLVLLENHGILPLSPQVRKVAVIGPNADSAQAMYGDWAIFTHPTPHPDAVPALPVDTVLAGVRQVAADQGVEVAYHWGCDVLDAGQEDILGAVSCAQSADAVVLVLGDHLDQNGETKDRADLSLSGAQGALLRALRVTGKPLCVVLLTGKPLAAPEVARQADAVLQAFNPGHRGGLAIAQALWGDFVPSGRLSISFPQHSSQVPVYYNHYDGWHGGKYMDQPAQPLYAFGYGLSYAQFKYRDLALSTSTAQVGQRVDVSVEVENASAVDADEVVQLYVTDCVSSVQTPVKQLKGFARIHLPAGTCQRVVLPLDTASLTVVNAHGQEVVEPGAFRIWVGHDSREDSLLQAELHIQA